MDDNTGIVLDSQMCRKFGFLPTTSSFFRRNGITRLKQLCDFTSEELFDMRNCHLLTFTNIVEVLYANAMHLRDYSTAQYSSIKKYIKVVSDNYIEKQTNKLLETHLEQCSLNKIEELDLPSRYITILKKIGVYSVKTLLSYDRSMLKATKQFGDKSITEITEALMKHDLTIKGDKIYSCSGCDTFFSAPINLKKQHYCPLCTERQARLESAEYLYVVPSEMNYTSFTSIDSGFDVFVNIKNITNDLLKVTLREMYIISQGRQFAPKYFLTGYNFDVELIMPDSLKTVAKIWDLKEFNGRKLVTGDELHITFYVPSLNKTLLYKFVYDADTLEDWIRYDYFEV